MKEPPPFGFTRLPSQKAERFTTRLRGRLIKWLAGDMSVVMNCSTAEGIGLSVNGAFGKGSGFIENVRLGVPPSRPHLRETCHFRLADEDDV